MFYGVWGHCITDEIRRMWFLNSADFKTKFKNCKIVYISYPNYSFKKNFIKLLKIIGIDYKSFVPVEKITRFSEIIIPDESLFYDENGTMFFTDEYKNMIEKVREFGRQNFKKLPFDKIYLTYSHFVQFKQIGEKKLERFFKRQGYKIIAPEKYSLEEQLNIFQNCRSFASTIGSCSHNSIFLNDGTEAIFIPRANYLTNYQETLNEIINADIKYVSSDFSILANKNGGPFYYYVSENLMKLFDFKPRNEKKFWRKNLSDFKKYLDLGTRKMSENSADYKIPDYYAKVFVSILPKLFDRGKECLTLNQTARRKIKKILPRPVFNFLKGTKNFIREILRGENQD